MSYNLQLLSRALQLTVYAVSGAKYFFSEFASTFDHQKSMHIDEAWTVR